MAKRLAEEVEKMKEGQLEDAPRRGVLPRGDAGRLLRGEGDRRPARGEPEEGDANTVGDIDILTTDAKAADAFVSYPGVDRVIERGRRG